MTEVALSIFKKKSISMTALLQSLFRKIIVKLCHHRGHYWSYRDYSNHIKSNGDSYDFIAARTCTRCGQYAYFSTDWKNAEKSLHDYESNFYASRKLTINGVRYS
jgi:hypothetical protein